MPKRLRHYLPTPEAILAKRWCAPFRPLLGHPSLWHLSRRSVPGAMAIGLFCGLIPGPFQMLGAFLLAVPLRKNIPLALAVTFYTNPFTIVPLYLLAYAYGHWLLPGERAAHVTPFQFDWGDLAGSMHGLGDWMLSLGKPLAVGLVALACTLALLGYLAVQIAWRAYVVAAWRARARRRRERA